MSGDTATQKRRGGSRFGSFVRELLIVVIGALVVSSLLRAFVGQMFIIPSESMENTLLIGDRVVVQKITDVQRGDVAVFEDPGGWLDSEPAGEPGPLDTLLEFIGFPTASSPEHLIKRVIGMPGDRVVCCDADGRITVNGKPLDETSYLYTDPDGIQVAPSDITFDVTVPAGSALHDGGPPGPERRLPLPPVRPVPGRAEGLRRLRPAGQGGRTGRSPSPHRSVAPRSCTDPPRSRPYRHRPSLPRLRR